MIKTQVKLTNKQLNSFVSLMVYSGKGGVGKSTTTISLVTRLAQSGKRVYVLDGDVNSPSLPVFLGKKAQVTPNIRFASTGLKFGSFIHLQKTMITEFINDTLRDIKEYKPDILIIDTPPSITDVHMALIKRLALSSVLFVTQPNELSMTDVKRTAGFFEINKIGVIGIVSNMTGGQLGNDDVSQLGYPVLAEIPFDTERFKAGNGFKPETPIPEMDNLVAKVLSLEEVEQKFASDFTSSRYNNNITMDEILSQYRNGQNPQVLKFYNPETWDEVRDLILDSGAIHMNDRRLDTTPEQTKAMLDAFKNGRQAYFRINRQQSIGCVPLMFTEIGLASLVEEHSDSYYGLPRIAYQTAAGAVTLFPDEVVPTSYDEIQEFVNEGMVKETLDQRFLPTKESMEYLHNMYGGNLSGIYDDWEDQLTKALEIANG
ncbi:TPA: hypothetical protein I7730_00580 [Vibrio vulnificus]|uniref:Uncharacterized protein n=1 Tax=Vibrio vulnificus TaxID=672 RepID=A0A8H9K558_VIBVL|nr:P-loop NTPase [Vibrio vulnificus]HAS8538294.1 hypothetical protein [Vibrio vulnificus]